MTEFNFKTPEESKEDTDFRFSDQALGAVMMALQNSLMEQSDIVPILKSFKLESDKSGNLVVLNPPTVDALNSSENHDEND